MVSPMNDKRGETTFRPDPVRTDRESDLPNTGCTMNLRIRLLLLAGAVVLGCTSSTGGNDGNVVPPGDLNYLRLTGSAPTPCADSVGFWAFQGQSVEGALSFGTAGDPCPDGEDFLRLKLDAQSLWRYPDGTPFKPGDSVFISIKWVGGDSILFQLQPTGLRFTAGKEAELTIEYGEAGTDLNGDGDTDAEDATIESELSIWRQEHLGDPFVKIGTIHNEADNEFKAALLGFSRYAIAY